MIQTLWWTLRETSTTWSVKFQLWHNLEANESNLQGLSRPWASSKIPCWIFYIFSKSRPSTHISCPHKPGCLQPIARNIYEWLFLFHAFHYFNRLCHISVSSRSLALLLCMAKQMDKTGSFPTKMKHMVFVIPLTLIQQGSWQIVLVLAIALQCDTQPIT